jgi:hypothetical protein
MTIRMGNQVFKDVEIPLLWGERAIVQDHHKRISIIDLSGEKARVEVLADEPAPGVRFRPSGDGIVVLEGHRELYSYNSLEKTISSLALGLPEVQIGASGTRIGTNWFSANSIVGFGVGVAVRKDGIAFGAPLPPNLAKLSIQ